MIVELTVTTAARHGIAACAAASVMLARLLMAPKSSSCASRKLSGWVVCTQIRRL
jgi:hypothetical protein